MAVTPTNFPGRCATRTEPKFKFSCRRIKFILPAHPCHQGLHKILQSSAQHPRREPALVIGAQQAVVISGGQFSSNCADTFARFRWRQIPPAFPVILQLLVKQLEHLMLKTAAFARVQFKNLPFFGVEAGMDKETKRTLGEFFQPADRSSQRGTVNGVCQIR